VVDVVIVMDQAPLKPVRRVKWKSAASASHHIHILTDDTRVIPSAEVIEFGWISLDAEHDHDLLAGPDHKHELWNFIDDGGVIELGWILLDAKVL
jgi:hypothetical protein